MNYGSACKVYEQLAATDLSAQGIRPGGLELTERALNFCGFPRNSTIFDAGCGTGVTLDRLNRDREISAIGIDASSDLLNKGRLKHPGLAFVRASGENLPFPDHCADGVMAECSLSVMDHPNHAVAEFHRVLKIGGRLILSDVFARNPEGVGGLALIPVQCCLRGAVSKETLTERLSNRGFKIDLWEDHSDLLTKFAVNLVFSYGSMNRFWSGLGSEAVDPEEVQRSITAARPGYFLLVARKVSAEYCLNEGDSR
jgi:arsenite methyltransferase